ncbi:hypothetical protein B0H17DRAFT_550791 [Mycena rosella]|uniref:Uncharacterized protein n=1 Tax=Mycena rosella TaxID=1033263 RepID=A0AAD7DKW8_MYCRO|nr:hypothetical protein B0H17DRAFT_550791 [Mycena rosella]
MYAPRFLTLLFRAHSPPHTLPALRTPHPSFIFCTPFRSPSWLARLTVPLRSDTTPLSFSFTLRLRPVCSGPGPSQIFILVHVPLIADDLLPPISSSPAYDIVPLLLRNPPNFKSSLPSSPLPLLILGVGSRHPPHSGARSFSTPSSCSHALFPLVSVLLTRSYPPPLIYADSYPPYSFTLCYARRARLHSLRPTHYPSQASSTRPLCPLSFASICSRATIRLTASLRRLPPPFHV